MYLTPPITPTRLENGFRTPIDRANPRDAFWPTRNINTFFKKRHIIGLLTPENCKREAIYISV